MRIRAEDYQEESRCPACGSPIDYCQGHGEYGDPEGYMILLSHDQGTHKGCHPEGCEDARLVLSSTLGRRSMGAV